MIYKSWSLLKIIFEKRVPYGKLFKNSRGILAFLNFSHKCKDLTNINLINIYSMSFFSKKSCINVLLALIASYLFMCSVLVFE